MADESARATNEDGPTFRGSTERRTEGTTARGKTKRLEGYGVGPNARRLLTTYWLRLIMVARAAGYYGTAFGGERGITQGDLLSPTIFNVVVDAVVRHWVNGIVEAAEAEGGNGTGGPTPVGTFLR